MGIVSKGDIVRIDRWKFALKKLPKQVECALDVHTYYTW